MSSSTSADLLKAYDLFLIDLWGVVWLGAECTPIKGSAEFIKLLQANRKEFYFLSNTVWPVQNLIKQLSDQGISVSTGQIITAGRVVSETISDLVEKPEEKCFFHAGRTWEPEAYFSRLNLTDDCTAADVLLIGDFRWEEGEDLPNKARQIEEAISTGKASVSIVCNPDRKNLQSDGSYAYQSGFFMDTMRELYPDHRYIYIGKPHSPIYEYVIGLIPEADRNRTCMIGDTVDTDIRGAENTGIGKVLVCSGNTQSLPEDIQIDFILRDLTP